MELSTSAWDEFLSRYPEAHLLQTTAWGELKAAFGWSVVRLAVGNTGAQILFRKLPMGFSLAYIPKGPLGNEWDKLWKKVDLICRRNRAILLKVEPDYWEDVTSAEKKKAPRGFQASRHNIQPPRTLVVDLQGDEEAILTRMKQKTRYNIRLAQKKGVVVHPSTDLDAFQHLMEITGERDEFGIHSPDYYHRAYELFHPRGACELLVADYENEPLAALMVFSAGQRAWYLYGASSDKYRDHMPTYLLQWEAMRWARAQGCVAYDLWGVPDTDEDTLEANFSQQSGGLWGVYRFKRGFGGELRRAAGSWDRVYHPVMYLIYRWRAGRVT